MTNSERAPIRVLIADDEADVRDAYRQILTEADMSGETAVFHNLRDRLFSRPPTDIPRNIGRNTTFAPTFCEGAEAAVRAVRDAIAADSPFAVAFLDMRMPPGPDGVWAAARIRELDPAIEIVLCTAYSDVDPAQIGHLVPPEEKLSYLQKPFHPHEIRQMTISLASKWRAEHRIVKLAYFDPLTGLPNREQSRNRLASAVNLAREHDRMLAVLYLDLDNFKRVNDTLGHAVGDELLCMVASRMRNSLRADEGAAADAHPAPRTNHIARLGGDEFIVVLPGIRSPADAATVARRLIAELQQPLKLAANTLVVTPSIGISLYPTNGEDVDTLLRNADLAMYFAKRKAPGMFAFFDPSMNDIALHRFTLEARLRGALERGEFTLHYQPQFDVASGTVSGMEALLALDQRAPGRGAALGVHSGGGGDRTRPADRRMGLEDGLPAGKNLARRGPADPSHGRQRRRTAVRPQGISGVGGEHHRRDRNRAGDARARDHRIGRDEGRDLGGAGARPIEGARHPPRDR